MNDKELIEIATQFRKGLLGDKPGDQMCGIMCYPFVGYLNFINVPCTLDEVDLNYMNHVFIRLPDGRVLDPTADQFKDLPPVYLGPPVNGVHKCSR